MEVEGPIPSTRTMSGANKIVVAIIIAAFIMGGFLYSGLISKSIIVTQKATPENIRVAKTSLCGASENTVVANVIDGDTLIVEGGYHVRLLGIDTDEKYERCFESAKIRLEELVLNKQVVLKKDITDIDKYGRCLRAVFLEGVNINVKMAREGLAVAMTYQPDVKYEQEIFTAEKYAIDNKLGCKWRK